jgi:hypothetical protein
MRGAGRVIEDLVRVGVEKSGEGVLKHHGRSASLEQHIISISVHLWWHYMSFAIVVLCVVLSSNLERQDLQQFSNPRTTHKDERCTYVVFTCCHNLLFCHSRAPSTFNIRDRSVTHDLACHIHDGTVSVYESAVGLALGKLVAYFFTNTQSLNTDDEPAEPLPKV